MGSAVTLSPPEDPGEDEDAPFTASQPAGTCSPPAATISSANAVLAPAPHAPRPLRRHNMRAPTRLPAQLIVLHMIEETARHRRSPPTSPGELIHGQIGLVLR
jgi:hypothetical protein